MKTIKLKHIGLAIMTMALMVLCVLFAIQATGLQTAHACLGDPDCDSHLGGGGGINTTATIIVVSVIGAIIIGAILFAIIFSKRSKKKSSGGRQKSAKNKSSVKSNSYNKPYINPTTTGRNDPCPCKSGLKYKNCCLD